MKKLLLFLFTFANLLLAQENSSTILQTYYSIASVTQTGGYNSALIEQINESEAVIEQTGFNNYSATYQSYPFNFASTKIIGDNNGVDIISPPNFSFDPLGWTQYQSGFDSRVIADITGNNNQFAQAQNSVIRSSQTLEIFGNDNISVQFQNGSEEPVYSQNIITGNYNQTYTAQFNTSEPTYSKITVDGDFNLSTVYQHNGFNTSSEIEQIGFFNNTDVSQFGFSHNSSIIQTGNSNFSSLTQTQASNYSIIEQLGDNNFAEVIQNSDASYSNVQQFGNNNSSYVTQSNL